MDKPFTVEHQSFKFEPSWKWFASKIKYDMCDEDLQEQAKSFFEEAKQYVNPSFSTVMCHTENFKKIDDHWEVDILGDHYSGKVLKQIENIKTVALCIQSCGKKIDTVDFSSYDETMSDFWRDTIKVQGLSKASVEAHKFLKDFFKSKKVSSISPGSGPLGLWDIEQLGPLFRKIEEFTEVDATIIRNSYMLPNKTICGIYYSADTPFLTCIYCDRKNCIGRKAPYQGEIE